MKTLLITGGAGFIGSNFVRLTNSLHPDWKIVVLDKLTYAGNKQNLDGLHKNVELIIDDICNQDVVNRLVKETDAVIHFAAESHNDNSLHSPWPFVETNIIGTYALIEAARKYNVRFHHISTDEVYGDMNDYYPIINKAAQETDCLHPSSYYSSTKASSDMLVMSANRTYG